MLPERSRIISTKGFQFKLKAVLDLRTRYLEHCQQLFAQQQQRVLDLTSRQNEVRERLTVERQKPPDEQVDPQLAQQRFYYIRFLRDQMLHFQEGIDRETARLNEVRELMRQAHVKKRSLELLKEKQHKAYLKNLESHEAKMIEDVMITRYKRA